MPKAKDAGQLLAEGVRLPVRVEGVREAREEGRTTPANFNFSIRRNASGQFVVVIANHAHTFSDDELHQDGAWHREDPELTSDVDPDIWFSVHSTDMANLRSGHSEGDHYIALQVGREIQEVQGSDPEYEGFAIVGVPTSDFAQRDLTATYSGFAMLQLWQTQFEPESDEYQERWTSRDATLTVDFADSTISGQINDLSPENFSDLGSFSLTMPETTFTANGFSGSFAVTPENAQDQLNVSFDGSFYGPDAQNAAGTMRANGRVSTLDGNDSSTVVGAGWFDSREQQYPATSPVVRKAPSSAAGSAGQVSSDSWSSAARFLVKFEQFLGQLLSDLAHWWCWHHSSWWQASYQYHRRCDRRSSEKRLVR